MNAQADLIKIPLHQLALSPRNARKTGGQDIDGLAASIAAHGLLQNLTVTEGIAEHASAPVFYQVIAGGRRLVRGPAPDLARIADIKRMRKRERMTWAEIGEACGISGTRACKIYQDATQR